MDILQQYIPQVAEISTLAILAVAVLAFVVSVIVEVIKGLPGIKQIPTDIVVFVLAILLSIVVILVAATLLGISLAWYYIAAAILLGFFVAFVAMFGWEKLTALWDRYKTKQ
ncbi:MAG: hypothetical protein ACK5JF_03360 [Oscillospiraceae bacterium]